MYLEPKTTNIHRDYREIAPCLESSLLLHTACGRFSRTLGEALI